MTTTDTLPPRVATILSNEAAWLPAAGARLEMKPAPYTPPRENEIVVKNYAVAINPIDWIVQSAGDIVVPWIKGPFILGSDTAGEVVEVGKSVTRFRVGDRVLGHAIGTDQKRNRSAEGSFQTYTVLLEGLMAHVPDDMSFERASVLPLGVSTAACGLFQKDFLALEPPTVSPRPTGKTLLVWGGSTSVGSNAIQLAVAAGYDVIATASPKNFDYVKKLGASQAFDYNDANVVRDVIAACKGKTIAGAIAIGARSSEPCVDIVGACEGNKFVAMATYPISFEGQTGRPGLSFRLATVRRFIGFSIALWFRTRTKGVRTKFIFGSSLAHNEVGKVVYVDFLSKALAAGSYLAAPDPHIVGSGLASIQAGLDMQRRGVSAAKVVISLPTRG